MSSHSPQRGEEAFVVLENIRNRRSVRRYLKDPVPDELLALVLEAANYAPSAHNKQAWRFLVLKGEGKDNLSTLVQGEAARFPRRIRVLMRLASQIMRSAPLVVAIFSTGELTREMVEGGRNREVEEFFRLMETQSTSAAVQNLMLAASGVGLGTVWLGAVCLIKEEIADALGQEGELLAVVPLGYPSVEPASPRKKPLSEVVRF